MADKRDEQENSEPKIRIVDRRMLSDDERAGKGADDASTSEPPKLEIIGGGTPKKEAAPEAQSGAQIPEAPEEAFGLDEGDALTEAEADQMREQMEIEQFAELEKQMGRPLTSQEKESVRVEMARQAEAVTRLEVQPLIMQLMAEMSARAAVHMGLMPNPYTRLVARNDAQARLAIDTFGALYEVLKAQLEPEMKREFERVLNELRVNFVSITGTQLPPSGGASGGFSGPRIIH
jgi:hypothetical protein